MITTKAMSVAQNDTDLVNESLSGNRDAFGEIVARYQSLICSLAYSATGNLSQSEDLAQETFVTAWKQLRNLREPAKLRSWLCAITRNLVHNWFRSQGREPSHAAAPLEEISESQAPEPLPLEQTISKEEQAILWRSLEHIPETYREPLVLFYREHQSIERVAENLELSEDAVKQRLSRGRKLLHEQVLAFVEGALERTNPGKAFTIGVLAALPVLTLSAKAATLGAAAAKGTATAKVAATSGILGAVLGPFLIVFGNYVGYRMNLDAASSEREAEYIKSFYRKLVLCILGFSVAFGVLILAMKPFITNHHLLFTALLIGVVIAYLISIAALSVWSWRSRRKLLGQLDDVDNAARSRQPAWEYRSKWGFLGLPLVHCRVGGGIGAHRNVVKAWIAVGDCAIGGLLAFGGVAIAPFSIGGVAIGFVPFGGCALGVLALGGLGVGFWAFGGLAVGWQAFGGCALAWSAACGGAAIAHDFAVGGFANALQANSDAAKYFVQNTFFFNAAEKLSRYSIWTNLIWILPMMFWWRKVKRARIQQAAA